MTVKNKLYLSSETEVDEDRNCILANIKAGDLVLFDIRLHHTGHANRLIKFPDRAMTDEYDNKKESLKSYLAPANPVDRIILQNEFFGNTLHVKDFKERFFNPQGYPAVLNLFQKSLVTQDYFFDKTQQAGIKTFNKPLKYLPYVTPKIELAKIWLPNPKILLGQEKAFQDTTYQIITQIKASNSAEIVAIILDKNTYNAIEKYLSKFPRLKVVGIIGNSLRKLNLNPLWEKNIAIINTGDLYAQSVAEYILMSAILGCRKASISHQKMKEGKWERPISKSFHSVSIGILGYGFATRALLNLLTPFNNTIHLASDCLSEKDILEWKNKVKLQHSNLETVLQQDIIIINKGLSPATYHLIGETELAKVSSQTIIINTARAEIVEEEALYMKLKDNPHMFYAQDVFIKEPASLPSSHPLRKLDNVFITSHLAGYTQDITSQGNQWIVESVKNYLIQGKGYPISPSHFEKSHLQNINKKKIHIYLFSIFS